MMKLLLFQRGAMANVILMIILITIVIYYFAGGGGWEEGRSRVGRSVKFAKFKKGL